MKVAVFSAKPYDTEYLDAANTDGAHELLYFQPTLDRHTARLAEGCNAACIFVNDDADREALGLLGNLGVKMIALRCSGFNQVDLPAADGLGITVARVPAYSPFAVAEHAVGLMLALNRKIYRAYARVREGNFSLDGLVGFDLHRKTVGIIGTGAIGAVLARILSGFGCRILAYDVYHNPECEALGVEYVSLDRLFRDCEIISLHCPLTWETHHLISKRAIDAMKPGVMLINTSRGALIDTEAAIDGLKSGRIGYLGLDVYEEEADLFFEDLSTKVIQDDTFARLLTFPNVIVTGHQAYFTREALERIAEVTIANLTEYEQSGTCANQVSAKVHMK